jgi:hypothetical protein
MVYHSSSWWVFVVIASLFATFAPIATTLILSQDADSICRQWVAEVHPQAEASRFGKECRYRMPATDWIEIIEGEK